MKLEEVKLQEFQMLDYIPIGICVVNKSYQVIFWNRCLETWTEIEKEEITGKSLIKYFPYLKDPVYSLRLEGIFSGGAPIIFSSQLHKHFFTLPENPHKKIHHTTVTSIPASDDEFYAMFSIENVTELSQRIQAYRELRDKNLEEIRQRKITEEELLEAKRKAEESDMLKSAFLANMSHEIRTPLNGIIGFSEFLINKDLNNEISQEYLKIINGSGKHLLNLINDIIDISKIEAGRMKISETECILNNLIHELFSFFETDLKANEKEEVALSMTEGLSQTESIINVDEVRLRQILTNLLGNAAKFTNKGCIRFGYRLQNENTLLFFVEDSGIGLPKDKQDVIFGRFNQADGSITREYGGTGLGLAISKGLTELLGGNIWVKSEDGEGSKFYFTLPYKPSTSQKQFKELKKQAPVSYDWSDKLILIVEDQPVSYMFLKAILKETNAKLLHANRGTEALKKYKENPDIDLILMDIQLPQISGHEATRRIKKINPKTPIIAQTANAMSEDKEKALKAGCNDYITKPIERLRLLQMMNKYLNNNG